MRKRNSRPPYGVFQYLNTTIYGNKDLLSFETLSIPGALLVADPFESHVKETVTNIATH
jgi:hypothetical protein